MSNHDLPARVGCFSHDIIVIPLEVKAELYQQRPSRKSHTVPPNHPSKRSRIGRPYFLPQPELGQIGPPTGLSGELVKGPPVPGQLALDGGGSVEVGKEQVGCGDDRSYAFPIE